MSYLQSKACFKRRILHASNSVHIRFDRNSSVRRLFQTSNLACIELNSHLDPTTITQRHAVLKHNGLVPLMHVCLAQYGVMAKTCQQ